MNRIRPIQRWDCLAALMLFSMLDAARGAAPAREEMADLPPLGSTARLGTTRFRSSGDRVSIAWSPDGKRLAAAGYGTDAGILFATDGTLVFADLVEKAYSVAFTPDSRKLVYSVGGRKGSFGVADLADRRAKAVRLSYGRSKFALSRDGRWIALQGPPPPPGDLRSLRIHGLDLGDPLLTIKSDRIREVSHLDFSPDRSLLASANMSLSEISLWNTKTGKREGTLAGHADAREPSQTAWNLRFIDDRTLLSAGVDRTLRWWDVPSRKELRRIDTPNCFQIALSPDGKLVASFGQGHPIVSLYHVATGKLHKRMPHMGEGINGVAFSPDGKRIATAGSSHAVRLWDIATGLEIARRPGHIGAVTSLRFSPDGKTLASRGSDSTVRLWDRATGKEKRVLQTGPHENYGAYTIGQGAPSPSLAWSPDGKLLAALERADALVWDMADLGRAPRRLAEERARPTSLAFSADGTHLVVAREAGLRVWTPGGNMVDDLADPNPERDDDRVFTFLHAVAFSPDGQHLAAASRDKVLVYDWPSRSHKQFAPYRDRMAKEPSRRFPPSSVAFSPGSHFLACGIREGEKEAFVTLHDPATGASLAEYAVEAAEGKRANHGVHQAAFSPDGRLLALACGDGTARVLDLFTGKSLAVLKGHKGDVLTLDFSPDGKTLATGGMDTTILLWDVAALKPALPAPGEMPA
ncbi:MAG: WD40 repeat domain-containing protein, partial [Gemmataceae bacterium]|nr:WD40 repeat domain-containing protein [Gemmataceae bacterium]